MTYTIFNGTYKNTNMFRLIDEITYTMKAIKVFLKEKGFDENKFELVLGGGSAGGHLSMLYSYMIKNPPIPIKFIYDNVGPVTIDPKYFFFTKNNSLENIEPEDIYKAFNENKLISIDNIPYGSDFKIALISFMNLAIGRKFNTNFDKIFSDLKKAIINEASEEYKELLNKTAYAFPLIYVNKQSIPTLCIYGGQDEINGVTQYALLKKKFIENNNDKIELIYYKYGTHEVTDVKGKDYEKAYDKEFEVFYNYSQKYFTKDNN